jgi:hypothetical protein
LGGERAALARKHIVQSRLTSDGVGIQTQNAVDQSNSFGAADAKRRHKIADAAIAGGVLRTFRRNI